MATYIQSTSNPAYFDYPTFEAPDEFLYSVARQKQRQFDAGVNAVRQQYNNMKNLPVRSEYGVSRRDFLMEEATKKLRSVAGADFSLQENVNKANSIYKPISSDRDLLWDIANGKDEDRVKETMDQMQMSKDDKDRAAYWDIGRQYVNSSIKKYHSAKTAEELRSSKIRDFVPYIDIIAKLNSALDAGKLSIKKDEISGNYLITKENGEMAISPFYLFGQSQLGTKELEVLNVLGTWRAEQDIELEMKVNGGNEALARQTLAEKAITSVSEGYLDQYKSNNDHLAKIASKREALISKNQNNWTAEHDAMLNELDDAKEGITKSNQELEKRIKELGFESDGSKNENYKKTLDYYKVDLASPYAMIAQKNTIYNWAAGRALASQSLKISANPTLSESVRVELERIKAENAEIKEQIKAAGGTGSGSKKSDKKEKEEEIDYTDIPLQLDSNPFGNEVGSTYDLFHKTKKEYEVGLYTKGIDLIQDAGTGLSADFLTTLSENMRNGAVNESIKNSSSFYDLASRFPEDVAKIEEMIKKGEISYTPAKDQPGRASLSHADVFGALLERANKLVKDKLDHPPDTPEELAELLKSYHEVDEHMKATRIFREDEAKIKKQILGNNPDKYGALVKSDGSFMSKDEFLRTGLGFANADEAAKLMIKTTSESPLKVDKLSQVQWLEGAIKMLNIQSDIYDKERQKFENDFEKAINQSPPRFLSYTKTADGRYGYNYPILQWGLKTNPESGKREKGEDILNRAFQPINETDVTKILNMDKLGDPKEVMKIVRAMKGALGSDITASEGVVYTTQVGSDGKSRSVIFKPDPTFLKKFVSEAKTAWTEDVLNSIIQYGIEVATDIPEVKDYTPSLVGRLINMDKNYIVLPELKDKGFSAKIEKLTNGRGYKIKVDYKEIDQQGNEKIYTDVEPYPGVTVPEQRLDMLAKNMITDILTYYYRYNQSKKAQVGSKVGSRTNVRTFNEEEYQKNRNLR